VIRKNIDKPFKESIQDGVLAYTLPHSVYPDGYHCNPEQPLPFTGLATGKKLEDIPLEVVGRAIKRMTAKKFVAAYEADLPDSAKKKIARRRAARGA
jgi:hypothetical protein